MADGEAHAGPVRVFKDLDRVDDEFLRQLATRVHLMDLAYAFGFGVPELLSRLETVIRPGMVEQLRSAIAMAKSSPLAAPGEPRMSVPQATFNRLALGVSCH